jgi:hypothetical protein
MKLDRLQPSPRDRSIRTDSDSSLSNITQMNTIIDSLISLLDEIKTKRLRLSRGNRKFKKTFISTWDTTKLYTGSSLENQIKLPLIEPGEYFFKVDWGDGTKNIIKSYDDPNVLHTYASPGVYTVKIKGLIEGWNFTHTSDEKDAVKLMTIESWGCLNIQNENAEYPYNSEHFRRCINLTMENTTDTPDLTGVTSLNRIFADCPLLVTINNIQNWDVSKVENFSGIFYGERTGKNGFADDLSTWDVSSATAFIHSFRNSNANFSIDNWNVENVLYFNFTFESTPFNNAGSAGINNLQFENLLSVDSTFRSTPFNQPIGNWNMSNVTSIRSMFRSAPFNQDISTWDTGSVTQAPDTFLGAPFNQDISTWDFTNFANMSRFLNPSGFSTENYDKLLLKLAASESLKPNVLLTTGPQYTTDGTGDITTDPAAAKQYIIETWGWSISDRGLQP